MKMNIKNITK